MKTDFSDQALEDIAYWNRHDPAKVDRIIKLLEAIAQAPFTGIGKPEALRYDLQGYWSRRIDREHRLVYTVADDVITIVSCSYHYQK